MSQIYRGGKISPGEIFAIKKGGDIFPVEIWGIRPSRALEVRAVTRSDSESESNRDADSDSPGGSGSVESLSIAHFLCFGAGIRGYSTLVLGNSRRAIISPGEIVPRRNFPTPCTFQSAPELTFREVPKGVAVIQLYTRMSGSEVQTDAPPPLAACGPPHRTTGVVFSLSLRPSHIVRGTRKSEYKQKTGCLRGLFDRKSTWRTQQPQQ